MLSKTDELKTALAAKGLRYVDTRGNPGAPVCFVGEAPGADEDQQGVPFVGASGRELDRMLTEAGLTESDCWWTNPYKTRPPDNKIARIGELGVPIELYKEQFFEELTQYKPTFIAALGATPLGLLCPSTISKRTGRAEISKWRGSLLCSPLLQWPHYVVPAYHPAFIFRTWDERQNTVLCLAKLAEEHTWWKTHSCNLQPLPQRKLIDSPGADDCIDYLRGVLSSPAETLVSVDIENIGIYSGKQEFRTPQQNRVPYVIGFATDPLLGICVELAGYERDKQVAIWKLINEVLRTKRQVGQNYYTHDLPWLRYIGFDVNPSLIEDTLISHHVLWPELSHKLDYQTFQYTREPYYKDEGKNWTVKEKHLMKRYNVKDVCVTLEIYQRQEEEFRARAIAA